MSVQSNRRWFVEQRQLFVMKLRVAQWWGLAHPGPLPPGAMGPEQILAHLKEHHPNLFEDVWAKASNKLN
jgi:hypothetical protein